MHLKAMFTPQIFMIVMTFLGATITTAQVAKSPLGLAITVDNVIGTDPSACLMTDGSILIEITNDQPDAIFSINGGIDWSADSLFTGLDVGDYAIAAAYPDTFGVVFYPSLVSLINPDAPTLNNVNFTLPNACAGMLGSITVEADSTQDIIYSIGSSAWQDDPHFADVTGGTYNVSIANAADTSCIQSWVGNPLVFPSVSPPSIIDAVPTDPSDCAGADGSILVLLTPGSSDPEFSVDEGMSWSADNPITNLNAGSYQLWARNNDGTCEVIFAGNPVVLTDPVAPSLDNVTAVEPANCGDNTGTITITATSGTAPLQYSINGFDWQTGNEFTGLAVGTYFPQVRNANESCVQENGAYALDSAADNCPDVTIVTMQGGSTQNVCLDDFIGFMPPIMSAGDCTIDPSVITMVVDNSSACIDLTTPAGFYGTDTLCVFHCDGSIPAICDTTFVVVRSTPQPDTIYLTMAAGTNQNVCLDNTVLQYDSGLITSANFCDAGSATEVQGSSVIDNCFDLTANAAFTGDAPYICVVQCYDFTGTLCDTTYVAVNVTPDMGDPCAGLGIYNGATIEQATDACNAVNFWCSDLTLDTLSAMNIYKKGNIVNDQAVACSDDPSLLSLPLVTGDNTFVFEDIATGCQDEVTIILTNPSINYTGETEFEVACGEEQRICLPIAFEDAENYEIRIGAEVLAQVGCNPFIYSTYTYTGVPGALEDGPYRLDNWTVNGISYSGDFADVNALLDPMNTWNPGGNWANDNKAEYIYGGNTNDIYSATIGVTRLSDDSFGEMPLDDVNGFENISVFLGVGMHNLQVTHLASVCSEIININVNCVVEPVCEEDFLGADVDFELEECTDEYTFCTNVDFADWVNFTLQINGLEYTGEMDTCFNGTPGLNLPTGNHEIVVSRTDIECSDTIQLNITCQQEGCKDVFDQAVEFVFLDDCDAEGAFCLPFDLSDMGNLQFRLEGSLYKEEYFNCEEGTSSINLGVGDHSLTVLNLDSNCEDELIVKVRCNPAGSESVLTLDWNTTDTICLQPYNLSGPAIESWNDCEEASGEIATIENIGDNCFAITGVEPGEEHACFVQCDELGNCDTLIVTIIVNDGPLPVANDDEGMAMVGEELVFNVLDNDEPNGDLSSIEIVDAPTSGTAWLDTNGELYFTADVDTCQSDMSATLTYAICNITACDTATVIINIICDMPETVSGFSPNGDGINDAFIIQDLDMYPEHELFIFNRWGAQILKVQDYQNDWRGTWDGADLPDGTYFWMLDTGTGVSQTGWVEIKR